MPLKQLAPLLYKIFGVDSKDCYRFYTDIKRRKNESRTYFIDRMQEKLNERMLRDEELERMKKIKKYPLHMRRQEYSYPVFLFSFNYILISTIYVSFSFL